MKAWQLHEVGDFRLNQIDLPIISKDEVLVRIRATGICGSDIPRVYETGAHKMPLVIGHEFSGEVVQTTKVDEKWKDKRVGIFPLIPCKKCSCCKRGQYEMCSNYDYLGSRSDGGFAEYVKVPVWNLIEIPNTVSFEAAAMLEPLAVSVHAIRRMTLQKDATIVVIGQGTIGEMIVMILLGLGYTKVLAIGNKALQKDTLVKLGLPEEAFCDIRNETASSFCNSKTDGAGADAVFECVGTNVSVKTSISLAAPGGKICFVGNPYSDMNLMREEYWKILRRQMTIFGTWNSSFAGSDVDADDDWKYVIKLLKDGAIKPELLISHRYSLEDIAKGFALMHEKKEPYIKVMMVN